MLSMVFDDELFGYSWQAQWMILPEINATIASPRSRINFWNGSIRADNIRKRLINYSFQLSYSIDKRIFK